MTSYGSYYSTLGFPMSAIATLSRLFMPPLYLRTDLSATPPRNRLTFFRDSSTACVLGNICHHPTKVKKKQPRMGVWSMHGSS
jgi:hypothetical protein